MSDTSNLKYALRYSDLGWRVFPLSPGTKNQPLCKWADDATTDRGAIQSWWMARPNANIGVVTGATSGIVVLDVDSGKGGDESLLSLIAEHGKLPHTVEAITGSGGRHIIFAHPGKRIPNSASKLAPGLDVRGDGGYIVVAPSIHPNGNHYEWEVSSLPSKTPLAPMPAWLIDALYEPETKVAPVIDTIVTEGQRDDTIVSLGGSMRRRGFGYDAIYSALLIENQNKCRPPLSDDDIKRIAESVTRYPPTAPPMQVAPPAQVRPTIRQMSDGPDGIIEFLDLMDNLSGRSIKTYLANIDRNLGGLERQVLTILAARTSMGKTTLAWQIARSASMAGTRVNFYSLEMSKANLWAKAVCGAAKIRWKDVRYQAMEGILPERTLEILSEKATEMLQLYEKNLKVDDGVNTTETIEATIKQEKPDLVVIDHLRLLRDPGENENKRQGVITERLKAIAKANNCAILTLAQLNRGVESRENKRPELSDLRDSGEIEENADTVLMMYRESYYDREIGMIENSETEVLVRKFRDDIANQRILLNYNLSEQWFYDKREMP
jgi:KaiC/GvpD/RAD55 family RecA-like ATPase